MQRARAAIVVVVAALGLLAPAGCARNQAATGPVTVLVTAKVLPIGKLVAAAVDDGSIAPTTVPADVAPGDAVHDAGEIRCLVPSQSIPAGTLLRRSMFVKPSELGLPEGLTEQTARVTTCG